LKFIADGMLGRLTRWLRLLGCDVKYSNHLEDKQLIAIAKKEKRILLTRDFELCRQTRVKWLDTFYVEGQTEAEKLAEIAKRFGVKLEVDMAKSRCPKCNTKVKPIAKEKIAERVEENTFTHYNEFWACPKCKQIYWQGAHWIRIRKTLDKADEILMSMHKNVNSKTIKKWIRR
jgi:uncharacterized protein with PIN domain